MSSESDSSVYTSSECGSSENEADSEGEEVISLLSTWWSDDQKAKAF